MRSSDANRLQDDRPTRRQRKIEWTGYLYLLPSLAVVALVTVYPIAYALWLMLHRYNLARPHQTAFIGLDQFSRMAQDHIFWVALRNTFVFSGLTIVGSIVLGFVFALLVHQIKRGQIIFRTAFMMPLLLAPIVVGVIWRFLYNPELGVINYVIRSMGLRPLDWLGDPSYALLSVVLVDVWQWTPYAFLVFIAGIESQDPTPFEAARIDGATAWQSFWHITLPLLMPLFWIVFMFRFVWSFRTFDIIYGLTQGGPGVSTQVLSIYIFQRAFLSLDMGYAAALSFVMLLITMAIAGVSIWRFAGQMRVRGSQR